MLHLGEIIRRIYKDLFCPVCGKRFKVGELTVKSLADRSLILATACSNGHSTLFVTTLSNLEEIKKEPVSSDDCIIIHQYLKTFKGDFQNLWKK